MMPPVILLAGGKGSRLQSVISDVPKPMAPIHKKPFLEYLINYLYRFGVRHIVLSVGYKKEIIRHYFSNFLKDCIISFTEEEQPLGTGGALKKAVLESNFDRVLAMNGDTWFNTHLDEFLRKSETYGFCMAIRRTTTTDRYGTVEWHESGKVMGFFEKKSASASVWMNAGLYCFDTSAFLKCCPSQNTFSMEYDVLPVAVAAGQLYGIPMEGDFIDIGIPEDYERASKIIAPLEN